MRRARLRTIRRNQPSPKVSSCPGGEAGRDGSVSRCAVTPRTTKKGTTMRTSKLATIGGIMAGFAGIPIAWGAAINQHLIDESYRMPGWFFLMCVSLGVLGPVIIGVAAKGQDEK